MQNTIKIERAKKNITQSELAKVLNVSRLTVHSIEVRKFNPSVIIALKMARYFNIAVEELFMLEETD
ncbi:MAG: transcriptional regulator [Bacteroidetes bacterium RBG_13_42_15]|nr:MAG: transcriptional regulator [Bacteroidetes bacterium RBG_13_42_15]